MLRHFLDLLQTLSILCAFKSHTNINIMIKILENRKKRKKKERDKEENLAKGAMAPGVDYFNQSG